MSNKTTRRQIVRETVKNMGRTHSYTGNKWFAVLVVDMNQKTRPRIEKTQNPKKMLREINESLKNSSRSLSSISSRYDPDNSEEYSKRTIKISQTNGFYTHDYFFDNKNVLDISPLTIDNDKNSKNNDKQNIIKTVQYDCKINDTSNKKVPNIDSKKRKAINRDVDSSKVKLSNMQSELYTNHFDANGMDSRDEKPKDESYNKLNAKRRKIAMQESLLEKKKIIKSFLSFNIDIFTAMVERERQMFTNRMEKITTRSIKKKWSSAQKSINTIQTKKNTPVNANDSSNEDCLNQQSKNNGLGDLPLNKNFALGSDASKSYNLCLNENHNSKGAMCIELDCVSNRETSVDNGGVVNCKKSTKMNSNEMIGTEKLQNNDNNNRHNGENFDSFETIIEMNKQGELKIGQIHGHFNSKLEVENFIDLWSEGTRGTISKAARGEMLAKHFGCQSFGDFSVIFFDENVNEYLDIITSI